MSTSELARIQAPVAYTEVRNRVNTVRALLGGVVLALALGGMVETGIQWSAVVAIYLIVDGLWRRDHGTSALPMLLTDTAVFATIELLKGDVSLSISVTFMYLLSGALLLLPIPRAAALVGIALGVGIPVTVFSPLVDRQVERDTGECLRHRLGDSHVTACRFDALRGGASDARVNDAAPNSTRRRTTRRGTQGRIRFHGEP